MTERYIKLCIYRAACPHFVHIAFLTSRGILNSCSLIGDKIKEFTLDCWLGNRERGGGGGLVVGDILAVSLWWWWLLCSSLPYFYLWVTWLFSSPGKDSSVSVLNDPPEQERDKWSTFKNVSTLYTFKSKFARNMWKGFIFMICSKIIRRLVLNNACLWHHRVGLKVRKAVIFKTFNKFLARGGYFLAPQVTANLIVFENHSNVVTFDDVIW